MKRRRTIKGWSFSMADVELEIKKASRLIYWLVNGYGRHGIPPCLWKGATIEWVVKNYNVEMSF